MSISYVRFPTIINTLSIAFQLLHVVNCLSVVTCCRLPFSCYTSFQGISILLIVMTVGQLSYGEIFTDKVTKDKLNKPKNNVP